MTNVSVATVELVPRSLSLLGRWTVPVLALLAVTACGGVKITPTPSLPRALIQKIPVKVGVVVAQGMLDYKPEFASVQQFRNVDEAKAAKDLVAIFEPRIEQFSFATARDTGSNYYATTIQYRIHVYNPAGERIDSFSLTGYGNSLVGRAMSGSDGPLIAATRGAMRDAAAKFMVQFPEQKLAQLLIKGEPLLALASGATATDALSIIEAVPIKE
jgi:hypothetical protein